MQTSTTMKSMVAIVFLLLTSGAHALAVVNADAFVAGDKRAIKDSITGLTWLDFGINNNKSYSQVVGELDSVYTGWRLPNENEVNQLWSHLFSWLPEWKSSVEGVGFGGVYAVDYSGQTRVKNLLYEIFDIFGINDFNASVSGQPYDPNTFQIVNLGMFQKDDGFVIPAGIYYTQIIDTQGLYAEVMNSLENPWVYDFLRDEIHPYTSTLLIKETSLPEGSSLICLVIGLLSLAAIRNRTH